MLLHYSIFCGQGCSISGEVNAGTRSSWRKTLVSVFHLLLHLNKIFGLKYSGYVAK